MYHLLKMEQEVTLLEAIQNLKSAFMKGAKEIVNEADSEEDVKRFKEATAQHLQYLADKTHIQQLQHLSKLVHPPEGATTKDGTSLRSTGSPSKPVPPPLSKTPSAATTTPAAGSTSPPVVAGAALAFKHSLKRTGGSKLLDDPMVDSDESMFPFGLKAGCQVSK